MQNWPWRTVVVVVVFAMLVTVKFIPDPSTQDFSSLSTKKLLYLLGSPRTAIRQAAFGQLIVRSKTVVPDLLAATTNASGDQLQEILSILEELMLGSDNDVAESAELALERIVDSTNSAASSQAQRILKSNATLRHTRALARIERLGGTVHIVAGNENTAEFLPDPASVVLASPNRSRPSTRIIVLDRDWQGGDAGLRYVARLFPGEPLWLHIADDAPVTQTAIQQLRAQREGTQLRFTIQGCLGVSYREDAYLPMINGITPGSPADLAGLRPGDIVVTVNGEPIRRFSQLVAWAREHHPGDLVELGIRRRYATLRVRFPIGTDFATGVCRCAEE